jgi:hypothetical protein
LAAGFGRTAGSQQRTAGSQKRTIYNLPFTINH